MGGKLRIVNKIHMPRWLFARYEYCMDNRGETDMRFIDSPARMPVSEDPEVVVILVMSKMQDYL